VFGTVTARDGGGYLITWGDGQVCGVWPDDDDHAGFAGWLAVAAELPADEPLIIDSAG